MEKTFIKIVDICQSNNIEDTFIQQLHENELIEIVQMEDEDCVAEEQLEQLQRYSNWYYELELNLQGIAVVQTLLERIEKLQFALRSLKNVQRL